MRVRRRKTAKPEPEATPALPVHTPKARTLPPVLTTEAVAKGLMPTFGTSGLSPGLEAQIPPQFRYWTAKSAEEATAVRDELVERRLVKAEDILVVDGEERRVIWSAFLAEEDPVPAGELAKRSSPIEFALRALVTENGVTIVQTVSDDDQGISWTPDDLAKSIVELNGEGEPPLLYVLRDGEETRDTFSKAGFNVFAVETRPGIIFASKSRQVDITAPLVIPYEPPTEVEKQFSVRLVRKNDEAEERYILGEVLVPDEVDSQNDTYTVEEVRKAAHRFMEEHGNLGQQHTLIVNDKLKILETYLAPVDFTFGETFVKKGTWLLAIRVLDDALWASVKDGSFTGFSIGGTAVRQPVAA